MPESVKLQFHLRQNKIILLPLEAHAALRDCDVEEMEAGAD